MLDQRLDMRQIEEKRRKKGGNHVFFGGNIENDHGLAGNKIKKKPPSGAVNCETRSAIINRAG
jgi:hypothetical protein